MWPTESGRPPKPGSRTLSGYALKWDTPSRVRAAFDEVFRPGSLVLPRRMFALRNHDPASRIGSSEDGTLRLDIDDVGLRVELDCSDTELGDDLLLSYRFGEYRGWSIGFTATKVIWDRTGDRPLRVIERADLQEVSLVERGAHVTSLRVLSRAVEGA